MSPSRREFIKGLGVVLSSLLLARCARDKDNEKEVDPTNMDVTCYKVVQLTPAEVTPTMLVQQTKVLSDVVDGGDFDPDAARLIQAASSREMVRALWNQLFVLATTSGEDMEAGQSLQTRMVERHRSALDELVALDELDQSVADQVHMAFEEASFHAWRDNAPMMCYEAMPLEYQARDDLLEQANTLNELEGAIDSQTIELAREAVMRDVAFFQALESANPGDNVLELWQSGEIKASAEAIAAAQFLVDLLLAE